MQVTQLGAINTDDHDQLVARLVGVIGIDPETALFYLEASDWNPHNAIQLHLQNNRCLSRGSIFHTTLYRTVLPVTLHVVMCYCAVCHAAVLLLRVRSPRS